jgi:hypothetical protein
MKILAKITLEMTVCLTLLCACANHVSDTSQSGFLSDYSRLERIDDNILRYVSGTPGDYTGDAKIAIDLWAKDLRANIDNIKFVSGKLQLPCSVSCHRLHWFQSDRRF